MKKIITISLYLFLLNITLQSQTIVDRIVAVVDREIVTDSELIERINFYAFQNRVNPNNEELRQQMLESIVIEKLLLAQAEIDSIQISEDDVNRALNDQLQRIIRQLGSEQRVEEYYGMPINKIKRENKNEMRKNLLIQRVRQMREASVTISRREVEEFYETYKDSLPRVPEEYDLAHIAILPKEDSLVELNAHKILSAIRDSIQKGDSFADLAKRHSQDGTASNGGDLGWARRGDYVTEFESALFALKEGELSEIVKTQFGLHIIQLMERRGESVHARHILLRLEKSPASDSLALNQLADLRTRALKGESFSDLAKKYSEDEETKPFGGYLGRVSIEQVPPEVMKYIENLKDGEISEPHRVSVKNTYGFQIILLKHRIQEHAMSLQDDFRRIEQVALYMKRNRLFNEWVEEMKKSIYWEVRI